MNLYLKSMTLLITLLLSIPSLARPQKHLTEIQGTPEGTVLTKAYIDTVARSAYLWAWPLINIRHRAAMFNKAPESGLMGGVLPVAPNGYITMLTGYITPDQKFVTCPNQDVVYGFGFAHVDKEPVVIQVPNFGDRFWVYALYDARTDGFGALGKQYLTKPGNYLVVGPHWKGKTPKGIVKVFHAPTDLIAMAPRIFLDDTAEDRKNIQPVIDKVTIYPLSQYTGKTQTKEWTQVPTFPAPPSQGAGETKWVSPETFFAELPDVLHDLSPLPGEEAFYSQMNTVLNAAQKDQKIMDQLNQIAADAEKNLVGPLFEFSENGSPVGNGWTTPSNGADFGYDYLSRAAISRSNMFVNRAVETKYYYLDVDSKGERLKGDHSYTITYLKSKLPPVNGFWSLTVYNSHHFFEPNSLNRYSLGTKNKDLKYNPDGSLTLYVQKTSPGADKESNWIPTPKDEFSLYQRLYWPKNGPWAPPAAVKVDKNQLASD